MPERHNASPRLTARLRNDPPWQQAVCDRFQIWTVLGGTALSLWPCVRIWTGNWNMPLQNSSPGQQFGTSDAATASTRPIPPDWKLWSTRKHMEHLSASLWAPVEADHHTAKLIRKTVDGGRILDMCQGKHRPLRTRNHCGVMRWLWSGNGELKGCRARSSLPLHNNHRFPGQLHPWTAGIVRGMFRSSPVVQRLSTLERPWIGLRNKIESEQHATCQC
ncbi:hypothetical protein HDK77DRAFT_98461 [Phyllosticta capitalensis]